MMAKISLRAYNQEIDDLIERGLIEEAIAHSRHILSIFPKHVDTYRLLGKAFLEGQRYGDAADILQRVLSSIPDDFVSHVGMSITREDEGNLDEAISHMERAFEIQPSNNAIQDELRRLYGRRDGFEPPKVRLTRGALARMYFKGELYQQAIAELRAGLVEDPSRLDLQTLLAQAYARSGQRAEAADACISLLKKLPYSLAGNQIMPEILTGSDREENTQAYRLRLQELDPYYAHVSPAANTPALVPDQAVTLERLDYRPGMDSQPNWAASLGASLSSEPAEEMPDWIAPAGASSPDQSWDTSSLISPTEELGQSASVDAEDTPSGSEAELPEWLREAGWGPSTGEFVEGPLDLDTEDLQEEVGRDELHPGAQSSDELAQAEIPDWLKELAPGEEAAEAEDFSFLESSGTDEIEAESFWEPDAGSEISQQPEAEPGPAVSNSDEEIPDWLRGLDQETPAGQEVQPVSEWQSELLEEQDEETEASTPEHAEEPGLEALASSIPTWLQELDDEQPVAGEQLEAFETNDAAVRMDTAGLAEHAAFADMSVESQGDELSGGDIDIPDWLRAEPDEESQPAALDQPAAQDQPADQEPEASSWQADTSAEQEPEKQPVELPVGLEDELLEEPLTENELEVEQSREPLSEGEMAFSDVEDWGEPLVSEELTSDVPSEAMTTEPETAAEEARWSEAPDLREASIMEEEELETAEVPSWLTEMESEATAAEPADPLADTKPSRLRDLEQISTPAASDPNELPDWMLAETDSEADLSLEAEIEPGEMPDWMLPEDEEEDSQLAEAKIEPGDLPDWLLSARDEAGSQAAGEAIGEIEAEKSELPDWVRDLPEEPASTEDDQIETWVESSAEEPEQEQLPAWMMEDQDETAESLEEIETPDSEDVPAITAEAESSAPAAEQTTPEEIDLDAAFAWMEGLAARQGAEEALLLDPEERLETPPDWIQAAAAESGIEEAVSGLSSGAVWIVDTPEEIEIQAVDLAAALAEEEQAAVSAELAPDQPVVEEQPASEEQPAGESRPEAIEAGSSIDEQPAEMEAIFAASQARIYTSPDLEAEAAAAAETLEADAGPGVELSGEDSDAAFAWLESLAARQGAEEALLLDPEERRETPPDWVQAAAAEMIDERPVEEEAGQAEGVGGQESEAAGDRPDWLVEMEAEARQIEAQEAASLAGSRTQELGEEDFETEAGQEESLTAVEPESQPEEEAPAVEPVDSGRMPDWLREMVEAEESPVAPPVAEAPPLPEDLLSEFEAGEQAAAADMAPEVGQAAEQEAPEPVAEQPTVRTDDESVPDLPNWLAEESSESSELLEWTPPVAGQPVRRFDLNQISMGELERLPGIGFIMAQSIVRYREANGPFEKVDDLLLVPGISPTTLEFVQERVYVSAPARVEPVQPAPEPDSETLASEAPVFQRAEAPEEIQPARQALDEGDVDTAADRYGEIIKQKQHLSLIIEDLQQAVQARPREVLLWQALGDALLRADRVNEAIEAYDRAEELLN